MLTNSLRLWPLAGALASSLALLSGCGGGSIESTVPTVSSVTTSTDGIEGVGDFGKKLLVTVRGSALNRGITVFSTGCTGMALLTGAPNESNANTAFYECTVNSEGTFRVSVERESSRLNLGTADTVSLPVVTSVKASTDGANGVGQLGKKLLITVNGSYLDGGLSVQASGCSDATLLTTAPTASNGTTAYYECTVNREGDFSAVARRKATGNTIAQAAFTVEVPQVTLTISNGTTTLGDVVLTLESSKAPITVTNFLSYVNSGFYNGTAFHRYSPNFVFQGGGYASGLNPAAATTPTLKPTNPAITLEDNAGLSNLTWTVAMARTGAPDSATSQFFINLADNTSLDRKTDGTRGYAVFATVTAGTDVVNAMKTQPCVPYAALLATGECLPLPNLVVTSARQTR